MQSHARALVKHLNTICRDFVEDRVDGYEVLFVHVNLATVNFKTLWGPNDSKVFIEIGEFQSETQELLIMSSTSRFLRSTGAGKN